MAAVAAKKISVFASEASSKCGNVASKVRSENKETFDALDNKCSRVTSTFSLLVGKAVDVLTSAFFPYMFVTFLLNIPPFIYGVASFISPACFSFWFIWNAFLAAIHMVVAVYVVTRIRSETAKDKKDVELSPEGEADTAYVMVETSTRPAPMRQALVGGEPNSWARIRLVMCYDLAMAIYYLLVVVWVVWQVIGTVRMLEEQIDVTCGRMMVLSLICGYLYMGLGLLAWLASLCALRYYKLRDEHEASDQDTVVGGDVAAGSLA